MASHLGDRGIEGAVRISVVTLPRGEAANDALVGISALVKRRLAEESQLQKLQQLRDCGEIAQKNFDFFGWLQNYPDHDEPPLTQKILQGRALVLTRGEIETLQVVTLNFYYSICGLLVPVFSTCVSKSRSSA